MCRSHFTSPSASLHAFRGCTFPPFSLLAYPLHQSPAINLFPITNGEGQHRVWRAPSVNKMSSSTTTATPAPTSFNQQATRARKFPQHNYNSSELIFCEAFGPRLTRAHASSSFPWSPGRIQRLMRESPTSKPEFVRIVFTLRSTYWIYFLPAPHWYHPPQDPHLSGLTYEE